MVELAALGKICHLLSSCPGSLGTCVLSAYPPSSRCSAHLVLAPPAQHSPSFFICHCHSLAFFLLLRCAHTSNPSCPLCSFPSPCPALLLGGGPVSALLLSECHCPCCQPAHKGLQRPARDSLFCTFVVVVSCLWEFSGICGIWWKVLTILLFGAYPSQRSQHVFVFTFSSETEISVLPSLFSSHSHVIMSSLFTKMQNLQGWQQRQKRQNPQDCFSFVLSLHPPLVLHSAE